MRRLMTIATDRQSAKLKGWIEDMSDNKCHLWADLETVNGELKTYFNPNNRESIQDHLNHLEYVFQPVDLRAKKWLVCGRGEFQKIVLFDRNPVLDGNKIIADNSQNRCIRKNTKKNAPTQASYFYDCFDTLFVIYV